MTETILAAEKKPAQHDSTDWPMSSCCSNLDEDTTHKECQHDVVTQVHPTTLHNQIHYAITANYSMR